MATGINETKINELKLNILDSVEKMNQLANDFESGLTTLDSTMNGSIKDLIMPKGKEIHAQIPKVSSNLSKYIDDLSNVVKKYKNQDLELSQTINQNIEKLEIKEERNE